MRASSITIIISLILSLSISSCSYFNYQRTPAAEEIVQSKKEVLQIFEFQSSNMSDSTDYKKVIEQYVEMHKLFLGTYRTGNEVSVDFVEDTTLPKGVAYFPEFQVKDNTYQITILHSKQALHDPVASYELLNFLRTIRNEKYFMSHFSAFEMYYNAIEQDPISVQNWVKIREVAASLQITSDLEDPQIKTALQTRAAEWTKEKEDYTEIVKKELKSQKKQDLERRAVIEALDKASEDQQFKNLVAKNDRAGVAELLKKYLPWEQMAPLEKRYWENYLNVITHPLPMDQRIFIYRGVDDDVIYSAYKGGRELEKEVAQKEGDIFIMSTIITKNQGTWNRRLRSLTAMNEKFIGTNAQLESEYTKSARIVTMFVNHSKNPQGSPFLSFTPKFNVAQRFGDHKMSAYALDPRLVSFNFASKYKNEVEFLLPLMAFPDDVVSFYDEKLHPDMTNSEELMKKIFKEKLIKKHGEIKGEELYIKVLANSKDYFDSDLNRYEGKITAAAIATKKESNLFEKFFNKIFIKKTSAVPPKEFAQKKGSACIDIISSFWN